MYFLDKAHGNDGSEIYKTKNGFRYPIQKSRGGGYKIKSGEMIRVCMTSDFFLEEADPWRDEAWEIIRSRSDVIFYLLTKRPERVAKHLPNDWGDGWENVFFNGNYKTYLTDFILKNNLISQTIRYNNFSCFTKLKIVKQLLIQ